LAARWLGVYYPPAILVLMLVGIVFVASLSFSVILSRQQRQISRLIEENAIMAAELRDVRRVLDSRVDGSRQISSYLSTASAPHRPRK
jgi:hypothetical protein